MKRNTSAPPIITHFRDLAGSFADDSMFVVRILVSSLFEPETPFIRG
ncbi:MAG: hypothetical protein HQM09_18855 [Candidatus Riflebacteria bacterium]|nr:hypothetical protein [Candidatus Riflebacteria bacterium]